jgi:valyl-tRNA synthetase
LKSPAIAASVTLGGQAGPMEMHVDLSRFIDVAAERKRLEKERENINKQLGGIESKLANKNFVDKAPTDVVEQQRAKLSELRGQLDSIQAALDKLPKH